MPRDNAPEFLNSQAPVAVPETTMTRLRELITQANELQRVKADIEERLKATNISLVEMYQKTLPDIFTQARITEITVGMQGNLPAVKATLKPFYRASISSEWPEEKQKAAFKWLDDNGHGDLIKTVVTISFDRTDRAKAVKFAREIADEVDAEVEVKEAVHHATLTAWLKRQCELGDPPPLETIGGTVSQIVNLKPTE